MGRPRGSKNKTTEEKELTLTNAEIQRLQKKVIELEKVHNSYDEVVNAFVEGFVMDLYNKDIIKRVNNETLQKWFSSPDTYMDKITSLLTYYYIVDGDIFQLYDLIFTLPTLEYNITVLNKDKQSENDLLVIKQLLEKKIRHKELTRDLAVQLASKGTLLGTWLGTNIKNLYFYTFDDLKYIYPYGRYRGDMIGVIDLEWLNSKTEEEQQSIFNNLSPILTKRKYDKYLKNKDDKNLRYITLPSNKTLVERVHTLNRNQRLGVPFGTQAIMDMQHKQKLKDLEIAVANKIIRAIAVLKFKGKDDSETKVKPEAKKKVFAGVKKALEMNSKDNGITCVAIPDFASFEFPELKNGEKALNPDKYESINGDITSATGVSPVLSNGTKGNYASASLNLNILYKKIGILLEKIEKIYNQLIDIALGERGSNYIFSYNTEEPLTKDKKLEALSKLQAQGFSTKAVLDLIGMDSEDYFKQSFYEIEELKLRDRILPPMSSYTMTGKDNDGIGRPIEEGGDDDNDSNGSPSPSD